MPSDKLMKMMRARRANRTESMPASGSPGTPSDEVGVSDSVAGSNVSGPDYHHEQVRKHLQKGMNGSRRGAKLHLKLALHHHGKACGYGKDC